LSLTRRPNRGECGPARFPFSPKQILIATTERVARFNADASLAEARFVKLVIPYISELHAADARLARLAQFMNCSCDLLRLGSVAEFSEASLEERAVEADSCLVINADALRQHFSANGGVFSQELASYLQARFSALLVHNVRANPFCDAVVQALSSGHLQSIRAVDRAELKYQVAPWTEEVCGPFSGLKFGPVDPANDHVFEENGDAVRPLVAIGNRPYFASVQGTQAKVFFWGSGEVADLDAPCDRQPSTEYFSRLLPPAMLLRYLFGPECWQPGPACATLIIDDPPLRKRYGFLEYERLLALADEYNFHTTIAFIPHNYRRSSPEIVRMFHSRPDRLSLCFHGNDHTGSEFAERNVPMLNGMVKTAIQRIKMHARATGLGCGRVMVFPQGAFSEDALMVLKLNHFAACVNTGPFPRGARNNLTLADFLQPAVLKYEGFPLFLRRYIRQTTMPDVAFNLFFGKPVLLVEHHGLFEHPDDLTALVSSINRLAPEIHWSSLQAAVANSSLRRWSTDGTLQIRAYSSMARVENGSELPLRCWAEWPGRTPSTVEEVRVDGGADSALRLDDDECVRLSCTLVPEGSCRFSLVHRNDLDVADPDQSVRHTLKVLLRRRLSDVRDNYLSKSRPLLSMAKFVQSHVLKNVGL
jgi:hypothetical protein